MKSFVLSALYPSATNFYTDSEDLGLRIYFNSLIFYNDDDVLYLEIDLKANVHHC